MLDRMQGTSRPRSVEGHVIRALEAEGLKRSRVIIVPTEGVARALSEEYPACTNRIRVLPHPRPARVPAKRSYDAHSPFRVLCVGRLISYKGVAGLFDALSHFPTDAVTCWVVGRGPQQGALEQLTQERGLNVCWLGQLPHGTVLGLSAEVDALVVPSVVETYGLVLQEGLQAGVPVVVTDLDVFTGRIEDGVNGLLVPINISSAGARVEVSALVAALGRLMYDRRLRESLGTTARRHALRARGPEKYAEQLASVVAGSRAV